MTDSPTDDGQTDNDPATGDEPTPGDQADDRTTIELEIEVEGTPEEVWQAIATGPGISSWYVPHTVDEQQGGRAVARFGEGPEMEVPGRVAAWEPPRRFMIDGGEGVPGLAFEWLVEAKDGGSCVVRLVNSGFGDDGPWDEMYDGMSEGWPMFLRNLQLHLAHFRGRPATPMLPGGHWAGPRDKAWRTLLEGLELDPAIEVGDRIEVGGGAPSLAGTVVEVLAHRVSLLLDRPASGTAFLAAEGGDQGVEVSVWAYLYGDDAGAIADRDRAGWQQWLEAKA